MRTDHIGRILAESVGSGKGARQKNLKVYVRFFKHGRSDVDFARETRAICKHLGEEDGNEYQCRLADCDFYFDLWPWGIVAYHTLEEEETDKVEGFLKSQNSLREPWIDKRNFEKLSRDFVRKGARLVVERCDFKPFDDYSGYGMTLEVRGKRTSTVIEEADHRYALHPMKLGFEIGEDPDLTKFEMTNSGRLSFHRGRSESTIIVIGRYVSFLRSRDETYEFRQSKKVATESMVFRQASEVLTLKMPSSRKTQGTKAARNAAIIKMLTTHGGTYGYIGIPISADRVSVLDLKERKMMQVTIRNDEVFVYSENPSSARSAIRTLVSQMAEHIDPDVEVGKIVVGGPR